MSVLDLLGEFPHQDYIILGANKSPGKARIVNAGSPRTWDIRQGYGQSGATVVFTGNGLARFDVEITLWTPLHFQEWEIFAKLYLEKKAAPFPPPIAIGIYHPILALPPLRISSVVVEDVTQFEQDDEGLWTCLIKFLEYRKPLPALGKPIAAIPAATVPAPTASDAAEAEMQAKAATLRGLAGGAF